MKDFELDLITDEALLLMAKGFETHDEETAYGLCAVVFRELVELRREKVRWEARIKTLESRIQSAAAELGYYYE